MATVIGLLECLGSTGSIVGMLTGPLADSCTDSTRQTSSKAPQVQKSPGPVSILALGLTGRRDMALAKSYLGKPTSMPLVNEETWPVGRGALSSGQQVLSLD
ncbi:hypothetical protein A1Q2_03470 [Trichosporon asahii var. asahii CBS 8904]|uniref:Uncharacterized protein n=1 Tax=Trichosporon asahii var. asahii (strain CBS 8904) TaxID=1220162 RepID=K1VE33_TRIAC|nr:hypothetical protein A1Q2_03470 [Trichosporon asahii var. asahii CBS 8904]